MEKKTEKMEDFTIKWKKMEKVEKRTSRAEVVKSGMYGVGKKTKGGRQRKVAPK